MRVEVKITIDSPLHLDKLLSRLVKIGRVEKVERVVEQYYLIHLRLGVELVKLGIELHSDITIIITELEHDKHVRALETLYLP